MVWTTPDAVHADAFFFFFFSFLKYSFTYFLRNYILAVINYYHITLLNTGPNLTHHLLDSLISDSSRLKEIHLYANQNKENEEETEETPREMARYVKQVKRRNT